MTEFGVSSKELIISGSVNKGLLRTTTNIRNSPNASEMILGGKQVGR